MTHDGKNPRKHRMRVIQALPLLLLACTAGPQGLRLQGGTPSPSPSPTGTPTHAPTPTATPSVSSTQAPTPTPTAAPTQAPTPTPTPTAAPTQAPTPTPTPTVAQTQAPTPTPTPTVAPTQAPTPTPTPTVAPTQAPTPTPTPTVAPTQAPTPTPTPTVVARFSTIKSNILQPKCAGCHTTTSTNKWAFSANQLTLWTTMTGKVTYATTPSSPKAYYGQSRVMAGDPDSSVLFIKVASSSFSVPNYGNPMPGTPLTASEIDLIRNWILAGAQNN